MDRVTQLSDGENTQGFQYDKVGRLIQQQQHHLLESGLVKSQSLSYHYDKNGNRTKLVLPNKDEISYLYYGSGHLSAIKYNDRLITEFSRDKLHREIQRTQGKLSSTFTLDPLGRLEQQLSRLENHPTSGEIIRRNYQYDQVGNLIESEDLRTGRTPYRYDKLGQLQLAGQELFHFDLAHNLIEKETQRIENNQVMYYQGISYGYDEFGNLSERIFPSGEVQRYKYNAKDKLIEASIQKPNQAPEVWEYGYDVLGRRINKRLKNGENLQNTAETRFIWDGSHLVQEIDPKTNRTYSYIYTHPSSYEPLAQLEFVKNETNPTACTTYYYHTDQIGIPRELTDESGKLCWYGDYSGWGKLKESYQANGTIHQPFRLQNQYCDQETGLHYNFFRYYEPNVGRFTQLDPIGLLGGENLYRFAENVQGWIDPEGLSRGQNIRTNYGKQGTLPRNNVLLNPNQHIIRTVDLRSKQQYMSPIKLAPRRNLPYPQLSTGENGKLMENIADILDEMQKKKKKKKKMINIGTCRKRDEQAKYECRILEKVKCEGALGLLSTINGHECYLQILQDSHTKYFMYPQEKNVSVSCKEK